MKADKNGRGFGFLDAWLLGLVARAIYLGVLSKLDIVSEDQNLWRALSWVVMCITSWLLYDWNRPRDTRQTTRATSPGEEDDTPFLYRITNWAGLAGDVWSKGQASVMSLMHVVVKHLGVSASADEKDTIMLHVQYAEKNLFLYREELAWARKHAQVVIDEYEEEHDELASGGIVRYQGGKAMSSFDEADHTLALLQEVLGTVKTGLGTLDSPADTQTGDWNPPKDSAS